MGGYISFKAWRGQGILYEMMAMMNQNSAVMIPQKLWDPLERRLGFFMVVYGVFMGILAIWFSTNLWTFFKTLGFYLSFGLYMMAEMFFLRTQLKKHFLAQSQSLRG